MIGGFLGLPIMVPLGPARRMAPDDYLMKRRFNLSLSFLSSLYFLLCFRIELLTFSNPKKIQINMIWYNNLPIFCLLRVLRLSVLFLCNESVFPRNRCLFPPTLLIPPDYSPIDYCWRNLLAIEPPPSFIESPRLLFMKGCMPSREGAP